MWDLLAVFANVGLEVEAAPPRWGIQILDTSYIFFFYYFNSLATDQPQAGCNYRRQNLSLTFYSVMKTQPCCSKIKLQQPIWLPFFETCHGECLLSFGAHEPEKQWCESGVGQLLLL